MSERIVGIASIPSRERMLWETIKSLYNQVDMFHVYLNGYHSIPTFLDDPKIRFHGFRGKDLGDVGKFYGLQFHNQCYYFSVDDDIFYPSDYAAKLVSALGRHGEESIICVHGNLLRAPIEHSYYKEKEGLHFSRSLAADCQVDVPGTGTMLIFTGANPLDLNLFSEANMSDIWMYKYARQNHKKIVAIAREELWLKEQRHKNPEDSIYFRYLKSHQKQIAVINRYWHKGTDK